MKTGGLLGALKAVGSAAVEIGKGKLGIADLTIPRSVALSVVVVLGMKVLSFYKMTQ